MQKRVNDLLNKNATLQNDMFGIKAVEIRMSRAAFQT